MLHFYPMTPKQKRIVATLAVADLVIILGMAALMMHLARVTALPPPTPGFTTAIAPNTPSRSASEMCQWQAVQQMVQAGLSGSATLSADTLRFEVITALAPDQTPDDAAQLVWTAFDIALALEEACAFTQVEVIIRIQDSDTTLHAGVTVADLVAYSTGALTEDDFIARVTYTIDGR